MRALFPGNNITAGTSFELDQIAPAWIEVHDRLLEVFELDLALSDIVEHDDAGVGVRPDFKGVYVGQVLKAIEAFFPSGARFRAEIVSIENVGGRKRYEVVYDQIF